MGIPSENRPVVLDLGHCKIRIGFSIHRELKLKPDHVVETPFSTKCSDSNTISGCHILHDEEVHNIIAEHCAHCKSLSGDSLQSLTKEYLGIEEIREHPILLVESALTDRRCRIAKLEDFFEEVGAQRFALANEGLMSLYACGRHTGVVVVSGHTEAYCCAIHEGILPPYAIAPMNHNSGYELAKATRDILRQGCQTGNGYHDVSVRKAVTFMETCGQVDLVGDDSSADAGSQVGEQLFKTSAKNPGVHQVVEQVIYQADEELEYNHHYYENVVLSGGTTKLPGLAERLRDELEKTKVDISASVSVIATPYREHAAWVGGSIAASLPTFQNCWITRQDYEEFGENILRRKCLR